MAYEDFIKKVDGKKGKKIILFALSTCGWCDKTKALLNKLGVEYGYVDVDLLQNRDLVLVRREFEKKDVIFSFPTTCIFTICQQKQCPGLSSFYSCRA